MNHELSIELRASEGPIQDAASANPTHRGCIAPGVTLRSRLARQPPSVEPEAGDKIPAATRASLDADVFARFRFLRQVEREKRRSDRSKCPLSIALFRFGGGKAGGHHSIDRLVDILCVNKRETDVVGYLNDEVVAVLLTDTSEQGTQRFVQKIVDRSDGLDFSTVAETYPGHLFESLAADDNDCPGIAFFVVDNPPVPREPAQFVKRSIDFIGAAFALFALSPLMLVVAVAVAANSRGPVIFRQIRLGRGGRPFVFYKFRSMYCDADERIHREYVTGLIAGNNRDGKTGNSARPWSKLESDRRITGVGRFLRKTCLDEVPQLFNVLKGDMSLVGPRPPLPYEAAAYESWHLRRVLEITPGITGLWQVEGGTATFDEMVRMDLRYVRTWSLALDLKILFKTVMIVLRKNGGG
jgi:lipopolysaccharide/colanic/teichoic acid biosynthesis glycosyltransferase